MLATQPKQEQGANPSVMLQQSEAQDRTERQQTHVNLLCLFRLQVTISSTH